ncbi:unnamed protein product [Heterobilharzia americana]|nr:unnamed protein product [Heterobilharzia americana]
MHKVKYILVTGGVISGIGKGIISSSMGTILKAYGWNVTCIKIDPYLNIDAGTFSPYEHGEVYVLDDGSEVDLDLGNYERFLNITLTKDNNITTGKIYQKVIEKERRGDYLGKTVQVVPHITDAIIEWVTNVARIPVDESGSTPEVCIIELGGTIGDIESMPYVEAFRQMLFRVGSVNFCCVHVSLVPQLPSVGEPKTKPTQPEKQNFEGILKTSETVSIGLRYCLICLSLLDSIQNYWQVCSSSLPSSVINKISLFSQVAVERVIVAVDVNDLYEVPIRLNDQNLCSILLDHFQLSPKEHIEYPILGKWKALTRQLELASETVHVAVVGKYAKLNDAYLSLLKALRHAAIYTNRKLDVSLVCAEDLEDSTCLSSPDAFHQAWLTVSNSDAVVVPGGFGQRGVEGKLAAIRFCRERGVPFLGLCLGLQCAVIEFARNVLGWKVGENYFRVISSSWLCFVVDNRMPTVLSSTIDSVSCVHDILTYHFKHCKHLKFLIYSYEDANSAEFDPNTTHPVIIDMPEHNPGIMGGTMRLGRRRTLMYLSEISKSYIERTYKNVEHKFTHPKMPTSLLPKSGADSVMHRLINAPYFDARHRHRYEVNPKYVNELEDAGLIVIGRDSEMGNRMEIIELLRPLSQSKDKLISEVNNPIRHPFFVATQFHPEYTSRPTRPSIFFVDSVDVLQVSVPRKQKDTVMVNLSSGGNIKTYNADNTNECTIANSVNNAM